MATNSNRPDDRRHISSPSLMPSVTAEGPAFLAPLSAAPTASQHCFCNYLQFVSNVFF